MKCLNVKMTLLIKTIVKRQMKLIKTERPHKTEMKVMKMKMIFKTKTKMEIQMKSTKVKMTLRTKMNMETQLKMTLKIKIK